MSGETMDTQTVDVTALLNTLITDLLPVLNAALPALMTSEKLDPLATVVSGSDTLGKINLGICTASAKASYSITKMTGLSSLTFSSLTLASIGSSDDLASVQGTLSYAVSASSALSANVSGKLKASCSFVSDSVSISGSVTAKGASGSGNAAFTADLSGALTGGESCLTKVTLSSMSLGYCDIDVHIDGLGMFNEFLQPLVDAINDLFGSYIKNQLSPVVENALDDLLTDELPLCVS